MDTITISKADYVDLIAIQTDFYTLVNTLQLVARERGLIGEHEARELLEMIGETVPVEVKQ